MAENFEDYKIIFEEYDVEAEVVTYEDLEYLQLVFPDEVKATYGSRLEYIEYDTEKEMADLYKEAKDMEQLMLVYDSEKEE